jgi:hypothetical protein
MRAGRLGARQALSQEQLSGNVLSPGRYFVDHGQGDGMRQRMQGWGVALLVLLATTSVAKAASFDGLPPWQFQMTPDQVTAFADFGPYKSFRNGDLETFAGVYQGHKENVQFFFRNGRLARIGIYLYEGQDAKAAAQVWLRTYQQMKAEFGAMELPWLKTTTPAAGLPVEALAAAAGANAEATGKSQMAPVVQPADKFVYANFFRSDVQGHAFYFVTVFYDPPHHGATGS